MTNIAEISNVEIDDYRVEFQTIPGGTWVVCQKYQTELGEVLPPSMLDHPGTTSIMAGASVIWQEVVYEKAEAVFEDVVTAEQFLNGMRDRMRYTPYRMTRTLKITEVVHA